MYNVLWPFDQFLWSYKLHNFDVSDKWYVCMYCIFLLILWRKAFYKVLWCFLPFFTNLFFTNHFSMNIHNMLIVVHIHTLGIFELCYFYDKKRIILNKSCYYSFRTPFISLLCLIFFTLVNACFCDVTSSWNVEFNKRYHWFLALLETFSIKFFCETTILKQFIIFHRF